MNSGSNVSMQPGLDDISSLGGTESAFQPRTSHQRPASFNLKATLASLLDSAIYGLGYAFIAAIQLLPLVWVAHLGRMVGTLAWHLDRRHRRITLENLTNVFGSEKSAAEIKAIARENFKRIGENYFSAIKTASMSFDELSAHVKFTGLQNFPQSQPEGRETNAIVSIGHFGNFELYARIVEAVRHDRVATTYRGFKQPSLNRLMRALRSQSGCFYFERRTDGRALRAKLNEGGLILGLLADQSAAGFRAPFMGRECNTGLAPAVLALRYHARLSTGICYRVGLAQWRINFHPPIATHIDGQPRTSEDLMLEVNQELEAAIRKDPANWFWVHRRWKR